MIAQKDPSQWQDAPRSRADDTVLIVDDDDDVRHLLRLLFEMSDFSVVGEASNGLEAVRLAMMHTPSFVILDYMMPGMTGDKAAMTLRAVCPETRIVAFSSALDRKPHWADAFLNKQHISEIAPLLAHLVTAGPP